MREVREETGLTIEDPRLCGVKQFQTESGARYVVFFYRATRYTGKLQSSDEGEVFWISREELRQRQCVSDLDKMMEVMESPELNEFFYYPNGDQWGLRLL